MGHPKRGEGGTPQASCAPRAWHAEEGGGGTLDQERETGAPPDQECTLFMHFLIQ